MSLLPKPIGQDRQGPKYLKSDVDNAAANDIVNGNHMLRRAKDVEDNFTKATKIIGNSQDIFDRALTSLMDSQQKIAQESKLVGGKIKDVTAKLADGLIKIEKTANFDKLERYVALLERAATAFETLSAIEQTGKLEKIIQALK